MISNCSGFCYFFPAFIEFVLCTVVQNIYTLNKTLGFWLMFLCFFSYLLDVCFCLVAVCISTVFT